MSGSLSAGTLDLGGEGAGGSAAADVTVDSADLVGTGTDLQTVLEELDDAIAAIVSAAAHIADTTAAHAASSVSVNSTTLVGTGTDAQAVFEELDDAIAAAVAATSAHLSDAVDAHAASAISASSTTLVGVATDVQGVLEELDDAIAAAIAATAAHLGDTTTAHTAASVDAVSIYGGGKEAVKAVGNTGATETIALTATDGNIQTFGIDQSCVFTMPSGLTSGAGISFTAVLTNAGAFTATFTGVKWAAGTAPVLTSGAGKVDIFNFLTLDGGTTWYGTVIQDVR